MTPQAALEGMPAAYLFGKIGDMLILPICPDFLTAFDPPQQSNGRGTPKSFVISGGMSSTPISGTKVIMK